MRKSGYKENIRAHIFHIFACIASFTVIILPNVLFISPAYALGTLKVDSITPTQTAAAADNTFTNGWKWTFNITVPDTETVFKMKFDDFRKGTSTVAASNIRISSEQSTNAKSGSPISLTAANTYSNALTLNPAADLNASLAGIQIQINVETRVPANTLTGAYSTSYSVFSDINNRPSIRITSPNGGETIAAGTVQTITWEAENTNAFTINLESKSGTTQRNLASDLSSDTRSKTFTMPLIPAGEYRIYITDALGTTDYTDGYFNITTTAEEAVTISPLKEIMILAPASTTARINDTISVRWVASASVGRLTINAEKEIVTNGFAGFNIATDIDPNVRTHNFTISQGTLAGRYKIYLTDGLGAVKYTDEYITIVN